MTELQRWAHAAEYEPLTSYDNDGGRWPLPRSRSSLASHTRHRVSICIAVIDIWVPRDRSISGTGCAMTSVDPHRSQWG